MLRRSLIVPVLFVLVSAGCGQDEVVVGDTTDASLANTTAATATTTSAVAQPPSTTTSATDGVTVVEDIVYLEIDGHEYLVDVYVPAGEGSWQVVVAFHGGGVGKSYSLYPRLASAIAERGAVVFVPNWDAIPYGEPEALSAADDGVACAVSYALAHAAEYGAKPDTVVLFGHSAGASAAAAGGLREATPVAGCTVEMAPFVADGLVLWEGDWILSGPAWHNYGNSLPDLMQAVGPWSWLATAPRVPVSLVTTAGGVRELRACGVSDVASPYWARDPDGWFRERLDAIGAVEDDCIDIGEPTEVLADAMREHGFDVNELFLEDSGHESLSDEDQALLVGEIIAAADR